jgi:hypothetical protein
VPDVNSRERKAGDRLLMCSDGLWEAMSDDEIRAVLGSDGSMRQEDDRTHACRKLTVSNSCSSLSPEPGETLPVVFPGSCSTRRPPLVRARFTAQHRTASFLPHSGCTSAPVMAYAECARNQE